MIKCKISMTRSPSSTFKMTHLVATLVPIFSIFIIALIIRYTCCRRDEYSRTLLFEEDDNEIDDETKVPKSVSQSKTTAPLKTNYTEVSKDYTFNCSVSGISFHISKPSRIQATIDH